MADIIYPQPTVDEELYCSTSYIRTVIKNTYDSNKSKYALGTIEPDENGCLAINTYELYCDVNKELVANDFMLPTERVLSNFDVITQSKPIYKDWVHEDRPIRAYFSSEAIKLIWETMAEMFVYTKQLNIPSESYSGGIHQYYYTIEPEYEGFLLSNGVQIETK